MREHDLSYLRNMVKQAFYYFPATKGQLEAFMHTSATETKWHSRLKNRDVKLEDRSVCRITDPMKVTITHRSGRETPLLHPLAYLFCDRRRAIRRLANHQRSWILYCYCHEMNFQHQVNICSYIWRKFTYQTADIKITKKVKERLKILVWLCAQKCAESFVDSASRGYSQSDLARLMGVKRDNWKKNYNHFWLRMVSLCRVLDREALSHLA